MFRLEVIINEESFELFFDYLDDLFKYIETTIDKTNDDVSFNIGVIT